MNVMDEIVRKRRRRIDAAGHAFGLSLPAERALPLVPFGQPSQGRFLICEIKRRSPSRGVISEGLDAGAQAARYAGEGVVNLSVLTEEEHFGGSLADLLEVKRKAPGCSVLRKDFLLDPEDIEVSYRAGADAVLLIAAVLAPSRLRELYELARRRGMSCLVEVHSREEAKLVEALAPAFTGINARDLTTFSVDLATPLLVKPAITWPTRLVFESGIASAEQAAFAAAAGFDGILVGESVVKDVSLIPALFEGLRAGRSRFWEELYARKRPGRPLVKVCGLTNLSDMRLADRLGADLLGFIFAPSRRRVEPELLAAAGSTSALKVGVVVLNREERALPGEVQSLLESGLLDAVQLQGDEQPERCFEIAFPYYKALQIRDEETVRCIGDYRCPRVLVDSFATGERGGTGKRLDEGIVEAVAARHPLWLAGGIGPANVREILTRFSPELIDASSGLELSPGRKDPEKLKRYFDEVVP